MKLNLSNLKWKWVAFLLLVIVFLCGIIYLYEEVNKLPPQEAVKQSLLHTLQARSYRFQVQASRLLKGQEIILSDLHGQKTRKGYIYKAPYL